MEPEAQSSEGRFVAYVDALAAVLGREDRAQPLRDYCTGLLMPGERKSVEPIAAVIAPARVSAKHQSLLHLVGQAAWSDQAVLLAAQSLKHHANLLLGRKMTAGRAANVLQNFFSRSA